MKALINTFVFALILAGCALSLAATESETSSPGNVPVPEHRFVQKGSGRPAVVFLNGLGGSFTTWWNVQNEVSQHTETFAYSRAGYRGTPRPAGVRDARTIVGELRQLLAQCGLEPPYILVGHSLGGLYMQYYARNFPHEVAGLVLVDSTPWDQSARIDRSWLSSVVNGAFEAIMWGTVRAEFKAIERSQQQVRESPPLRPMPYTVLTAGSQGEQWHQLQRELASQLPGSHHIIAERSGHLIQKDQPELVSTAVREVVTLLRETEFARND